MSAAALVAGLAALPFPAFAGDPLATVRAFCRADGTGARLHSATWSGVARLVGWSLEPAWDRIFVINGYEIGSSKWAAEGRTGVDVTYTLAAEIRSGRVTRKEELATHRYELALDPAGAWRIQGPPPPPHVFGSELDPELVAEALHPESGIFQSSSTFVWKMLHGGGWTIPYLDTTDLSRASVLRATEQPRPGDLVFYLLGEEPYHVGWMADDGLVLSASLNAGVRRAPIDAYAGEMRFMRVVGNSDVPADEERAPGAQQLPTILEDRESSEADRAEE